MGKRQHLFRPAIFAVVSLLGILLCAILTDPLSNIAYIVLFFILLFVFFVSVGHLIVFLRSGNLTNRRRYRIFVLSTLALIVLMFLSAQSLSLVDFLILILIAFGVLFYGARRASWVYSLHPTSLQAKQSPSLKLVVRRLQENTWAALAYKV
jgi:amino acid permease